MAERRIEYIALDKVAPAERNPKNHNVAALTASVNRFGFVTPGLRDERTGRLVSGHGRVTTLRDLRDRGADPPEGVRLDIDGNWLVPVITGWASRSDAEADAYLVADNRHTELGGWDFGALTELLTDVGVVDPELLAATGWDQAELDDLLKATEPVDLDALAGEIGEPKGDDMWPIVRIRCAPHVAAAWRSHLETHIDNENDAFAALLEVDPHWAPVSEWKP